MPCLSPPADISHIYRETADVSHVYHGETTDISHVYSGESTASDPPHNVPRLVQSPARPRSRGIELTRMRSNAI